jgi:nucleoside-diphosphate-sugar epimerase
MDHTKGKLINGSGMIAKAFEPMFATDAGVCIFASGVSNSKCDEQKQFDRENRLLQETIEQLTPEVILVYFGTCSVYDPDSIGSPYLSHKLSMESLVTEHSRYLICRLPQLAGRSDNPHTLLNYLARCISEARYFELWSDAFRNIIDVEDVVAIVNEIIKIGCFENKVLNIANPNSHKIEEIVTIMEVVLGRKAFFSRVERGSEYCIDVQEIMTLCNSAGVHFKENYLEQVIRKYYAST